MLEAEGTELEGGEFGDWLLLISHDIPGCVRCQHPLKVMCSFHFNLCVFEGLSGVSGGAGPAFVKLLKGTFWTMFLDVTVTNSNYFNQLKGHSVVFGKNFFFHLQIILSYQTKWTNSLFSWPNKQMSKQTDLEGQESFKLFYFVYMWRTLPPVKLQTVFWGPYFPLRTACLFSYGKNGHFWVRTITSLML